MFDDILDIVSLRNMFTSLVSFFQDISNGPHTFFGIPSLAGFSKKEVRQVLDRAKVQHWGDLYDGDVIIITVKKSQERQAHAALTAAGIPVLYPKLEGGR